MPARTYRVRFGDTLTGIAARFGTSVERLARANGLAPHGILLAGSTLRVSSSGGPAHHSHSGGLRGRYRVVPGDTLTGIAARFGVGIHRLARANGLRRDGILLAGITLRVPAHTRVTQSAPVATGVWSVTGAIDAWSAHYGVDPELARAISWQESGFQINIFSPADAWGPMQVTPGTWRYVEDVLIGHPVPHTGDGDIRVGVALLHHLLADFGGNTKLAVAAYYQGESSVRAFGMFPETAWYVEQRDGAARAGLSGLAQGGHAGVRVAAKRLAHLSAQHEHGRIGHRIEAVEAVAAAAHHAGVGEQRQVLGDVGLAAAEVCGKAADATLSVGEQVEQAQPRGLGQEPEAFGDGGCHRRAERSGECHLRKCTACATI